MKRLIVLLLMLVALSSYSQDKRFTLFARTELADKNTHNDVYDYGFNIGVGINYQMTIVYFEAETYWFPDLNRIDYLHFQGTLLGFNHHAMKDRLRLFVGLIRPGFILRGGEGHALFGHDFGIEYYLKSGLYIGVKGMYDTRADNKLWNEDHSYHVWSASLKIGITLN